MTVVFYLLAAVSYKELHSFRSTNILKILKCEMHLIDFGLILLISCMLKLFNVMICCLYFALDTCLNETKTLLISWRNKPIDTLIDIPKSEMYKFKSCWLLKGYFAVLNQS